MSAISSLVYEQAKYRKTSLYLAAYPNGLFVGRRGAIAEVALSEYGYEPAIPDVSIRTLPELREAVDGWVADGTLKQFDALIVDDWSLISHASMGEWEAAAEAKAEERSRREGRKVGVSGFEIWNPYRDCQSHILSVCTNLNIHFGAVAHIREPKDGRPGIPDVPSANLGKNLPAWFDIVARARESKDWADPSMPYELYAKDSDKNWITNDRTGVIKPTAPMNLRAILRMRRVPTKLSRLPGLEWQDDVADEVAAEIVSGVPVADVIAARFPGGIPEPPDSYEDAHARWPLQDGLALGMLMLRKQRRLAAAGKQPGPE